MAHQGGVSGAANLVLQAIRNDATEARNETYASNHVLALALGAGLIGGATAFSYLVSVL